MFNLLQIVDGDVDVSKQAGWYGVSAAKGFHSTPATADPYQVCVCARARSV